MSDPKIKRIPENIFEAQRLFMHLCDQQSGESTAKLYLDLIAEEFNELVQAHTEGNDVAIFDALCDLIVVIAGMAAAKRFPMNAGMAEVYRSNFSKIDLSTGRPWLKRADGKVLKDEHFIEPNLVRVLIGHNPVEVAR